ncbi:hypothetical protein ACRAWD_31070 [Caulobacter segnis]
MIQAALDGVGVAFAFEDQVADLIAAGKPVRVLRTGRLLRRLLPALSQPSPCARAAAGLHRLHPRRG